MKSVVVILPLGLRRFPDGRGRSNLQCSERVLCAKNAEFDKMREAGGSAVSYAWFVWRKGWRGDTHLDWINHPSAQYAKQLELF